MKKLIYLLLFSAFFCLEGVAQKQQNAEPLSNKTTLKGRRELRKEMRIHNSSVKMASKNERKARREHELGTANHHDSKAKKLSKERRKTRLKTEKEQAKKDKQEKSKSEPAEDSKG